MAKPGSLLLAAVFRKDLALVIMPYRRP
jgi:hypothetical protein